MVVSSPGISHWRPASHRIPSVAGSHSVFGRSRHRSGRLETTEARRRGGESAGPMGLGAASETKQMEFGRLYQPIRKVFDDGYSCQ